MDQIDPHKTTSGWTGIIVRGVLLLIVIGIFIGGDTTGLELMQNSRVTSTVAQAKSYRKAVATFREKYGALPGDMAAAGKALPGCTGENGSDCDPYAATAGDGIVGNADFASHWKPQTAGKTQVPATSAADETVLFWHHLFRAGLVGGVNDDGTKDGKPVTFGTTMPLAKMGGGFVVGYSDGTRPPGTIDPEAEALKGLVLMIISQEVLDGKAAMSDEDEQPSTPLRAAQVDRKMDDGLPFTGDVRVYGSPECVKKSAVPGEQEKYIYNELNSDKDCGLIFKIAD